MDPERSSADVRRLVDAILSLGSELDLSVVLRRLTEAAVDLAGARYGALGVLDADKTALSAFITVGIDDEEAASIGDLPEGNGILGVLIVEPKPLRLDDLSLHPESFGFPAGHPTMTSFLGVPVMVRGEVFGNLYLTDKAGGGPFDEADEELVVGLAAAAGVAIENARLLQRTRELDIANERERIARDLHDTVIQRLFATGLSLQAAARGCDVVAVNERIAQAVDELDVTVREVRSAIFELNPPPSSSSGLRRELLSIGDELFDALGYAPTFRFEGPVDSGVPDALAPHLVAVVREGLANVAKHAGSPMAEVRVTVGSGSVTVRIVDAGRGLSARATGGHGLDNLRARATEVDGTFEARDRPDGGAELRWRAPLTG
ncbi:MAG: GAF domain-containing protein [Acidimicrobiales bacterium]|nr:GAF domain-containing protein [Acidimicrobiales bacterium]